jgi:hypothetical protein
VVALLDDPAVLQDVDAVGGADAREPVGDEQHGAAAEERADAVEELVLGARVEGGGGLVEDDEGRIPEEGAGQGDALPLADREVDAAAELLPQHRAVALWEVCEERVGAGSAGRIDHCLHVVEALVPPRRDVVGRREQVADEVLEDDRDRGADLLGLDRRDVDAVPGDPPRARRVEAGEQLGQGRLAGAVLPDERHHLAGSHLDGDVDERRLDRLRGTRR